MASPIRSDQQYETIIKGLNENKRIVYKEDGGFKAVSRSEAKRLEKEGYTIDLPALQEKIKQFIETSGINAPQKEALELAFEKRAKKLAGRFVLFGNKERNKAVQGLMNLKGAITTAAQSTKISKNIEPSSSGPQTNPLSQTTPTPIIKTETKTEVKKDSSEKEETKTGKPKATPQPPSTTAIPPPPPPLKQPGAPFPPLAQKKFDGEPTEPNIEYKEYRNKDKEVLRQEMQQIESFIAGMEAVLSPIEEQLKRHETLTLDIATVKKNFFEPKRAEFESLQQKVQGLTDLFNEGKSWELALGDGAIKFYSDEEYEKEQTLRSDPKVSSTYTEKQPLTPINKTSFNLQIAYNRIKAVEKEVGHKGEEIIHLLDSEGREIAPVTVRKGAKPKDIDLIPEVQQGFVALKNAAKPLRIERRQVQEDGTFSQQLKDLEAEKKTIEQQKNGDFEFKDFDSRFKTKKNRLNIWKTALTNRKKALAGTLTTARVSAAPTATTEIWGDIISNRPEMVEAADKWSKVDPKFKNNVAINPEEYMIKGLMEGKINS